MRSHGFTLWKFLLCLAVIAILGAIFFPALVRKPVSNRRALCQSNLKQLGLAIMQYSQDYSEHYPPVAIEDASKNLPPFKTPYGWADAIYPYTRRIDMYQCPSDDVPVNDTHDAVQNDFTDYYFNTNLSALEQEKINSMADTIMMGDGRDGVDRTDSRYNYSKLPQSWSADMKSPASRHVKGANYSFADGHVKWLKAEKIMTKRTASEAYSFAVQ